MDIPPARELLPRFDLVPRAGNNLSASFLALDWGYGFSRPQERMARREIEERLSPERPRLAFVAPERKTAPVPPAVRAPVSPHSLPVTEGVKVAIPILWRPGKVGPANKNLFRNCLTCPQNLSSRCLYFVKTMTRRGESAVSGSKGCERNFRP
jgi:hypothetical protein